MNNGKTARIVLYALLIFIGGAATGLLSGPVLGRYLLRPPTPEQISRHVLSMLQSRLDLTPEQTAQIKPIMKKTGGDMRVIWLQTTKLVAARLEETNRQIASHLTEEQKPKLEAFFAEGRQRTSKEMPFIPPPR